MPPIKTASPTPPLSSKSNSAKKNFEIVDNYTTDLLNNSKEPTNTEQKFYVKDKFEKAEKRGGKRSCTTRRSS